MIPVLATTVRETGKTIAKDAIKETSEIVIKDVSQKISPKELLSSSDLRISFDEKMMENIDSLVDKDFNKISEISNYSEDVNKFIRNPNEIKVYENANLDEAIVNDRIVLKSIDIDPNITDAMGRTNIDRMDKGLAPIDAEGSSYNLHHIGQKMDSPLAELKQSEHNIYDKVLHEKTIKTEIHNDENESLWNTERKQHWKTRATEIKDNINV